MRHRTPALVVRCLGTTDVIVCVQFARQDPLLLCIEGGGHNIAGLATAPGHYRSAPGAASSRKRCGEVPANTAYNPQPAVAAIVGP